MITVSHPQVNQYVRALLAGLLKHQALYEFYTTLSVGKRRIDIPGINPKVRQFPCREVARLIAQRLGQEWLTRHNSGVLCSDAVAQEFDRYVANHLNSSSATYCYEDSALETFRSAQRIGMRRFYELPILYWETAQKLLREEAIRYPQWEQTLQATMDSPAKLERKSMELKLADWVICPSRQVQRSLPPGTASIVAEYGCPPVITSRPGRNKSGLRVLFVGTMTQRKGLADLFMAMKLLGRSEIELVVLGTPLLPLQFYKGNYSGFKYEPPRHHRAVRELMLTCDVLVLPSIVEGRAMVQMEALSCGLPIVVTPNAGAEDLVDSGRTGFLVPIRAPEALAERINWIADNRDWADDMRPVIMERARQSDWHLYSQKVLAILLWSPAPKTT
jgi:glycosyltransferase involved in cell wall biosynthesis